MKNILIIPNIRSVVNVGAMFRTADAVGIDKIYLVGITPTPLDRFGRVRRDMAKSALGAENSVAWEYREDLISLIKELKQDGFQVIAVEQDEKSIKYKEVETREKNAFIMGPEVEGLSQDVLETCDIIAEIPMKGEKESLNVSVACGVVLFTILGN